VTLGKYGPLHPEFARKLAQQTLRDMAMGIDPNRRKRLEKERSLTVGQAFELFFAAKDLQLSPVTIENYRLSNRLYLSVWANWPIRDVTRQAVLKEHRRISVENGAPTANNVFRHLRSVYNFIAAAQDDLSANPVMVLTQARGWNPERLSCSWPSRSADGQCPEPGNRTSELRRLAATELPGRIGLVHHSRQHWVWGYGIYQTDVVAQEQIYATTVAIMANSVWVLTGGTVKPIEVILPFRQPDYAGPYIEILGAPVRFNQREAPIVMPLSALDAPIPGANPAELKRLQELIARRMPASDKVWTERVNHAIRPLILRGQPTTAHMADMLGVNVRMLARRLEHEGTTFQTLLDIIRYGMARELLLITDLPVGDIADALAYAHQSGFGNACVRWSGKTPRDWRTANLGNGQGR
jgi:AraC-like DNA-binding protein